MWLYLIEFVFALTQPPEVLGRRSWRFSVDHAKAPPQSTQNAMKNSLLAKINSITCQMCSRRLSTTVLQGFLLLSGWRDTGGAPSSDERLSRCE